MCIFVPTAACLFILDSLESIMLAQWAQCYADYKMWYHSISMHTGMYGHQSWWNVGIFSLPAEVTGFLEYELHIEGIVLYFWSSILCIKIWIVIYYRGRKFAHKAVVLLPLESDAAFTSLNDHSARKSAVLVVVRCYKATGDREHILWRYWPPEGCITKWYDKPTGDGCLCKKCGLGEQWNSDVVSCTLSKHFDIRSENTRFEMLIIHTTGQTHHSHSR